MEFTILGSSAMVPTKERNVTGNALEYKGEVLLFDCGEGSQRQMNLCGINRKKVSRIFISHWHADHVAGLLGLIQTISDKEKNPTLHIYGPIETEQRIQHLLDATIFDQQVDIQIHEIVIETSDDAQPTVICDAQEYAVEAIALNHGIPCLGYCFVEKDRLRMKPEEMKRLGIPTGPLWNALQQGRAIDHNGQTIQPSQVTRTVVGKRLAYIADTGFCQSAVTLSQNADLLVCESTHTNAQEDIAEKYNHLTSKQAAQIASLAHVKRLVLTHISQRYKSPADIIDQAKEVFEPVELAYDFMKIKLQ